MFVNKKWSHPNNVAVKHKLRSPAVEILSVGIRPYYLPREFSYVLEKTVYVLPSANAKEAASHVHDLDDLASDAIKIITGNFNHCDLGTTFPTIDKYVTCATCKDRTIDLFYCNVQTLYKSLPMSPLGRSYHTAWYTSLHATGRSCNAKRPVTKIVCDSSKRQRTC